MVGELKEVGGADPEEYRDTGERRGKGEEGRQQTHA